MELIIYYCQLPSDTRKRLLDFLIEASDMFSITTDYKGKLTQAQFVKIQNELRGYFEEEERQCKQNYQTDPNYRRCLKRTFGLKNKTDFLKYAAVLKKQNLSALREISYKKCENEEVYEPFIGKGFLRNEISRVSGASAGGLYNILYYKADAFDYVVGDSCYDYLWIGKEQFGDLAFYYKNKMIAQMHTDRQEVYCYFSEELFCSFCDLKIAYES